MNWYEVWYNEAFDGYALLEAYKDGTYTIDYGCQMWLRAYKRLSSAKKYLENHGYKAVETVITIGGNAPRIWNGKLC